MTICRIALFLMPLLFTGCLLKPAPVQPVAYFDMHTPVSTAPADLPSFAGTVNVRPLRPLAGNEDRLAYRRAGQTLVYDEYNRWTDAPADLVSGEIYRWLNATPAAGQVVYNDHRPRDIEVSGTLLAAETVEKQAVLEFQIVLRDRGGEILSQKTYRAATAYEANTAAAVADAFGAGMAELMPQVRDDIARTLGQAGASVAQRSR